MIHSSIADTVDHNWICYIFANTCLVLFEVFGAPGGGEEY